MDAKALIRFEAFAVPAHSRYRMAFPIAASATGAISL